MIKPIIFKGTIEFNNVISVDTHRVRIKPQIPFTFDPGQFVTVTVGPMIKRSYSIASNPGDEYVELIGDTRAGGPGSHFFASAKEGQEVELIGPLGHFTYIINDKPVVFWSTGTGVVPFMSIIKYIYQTDPNKKVILNTSFRYQEDIFGKEEFEALASKYPNFTYNLYVSRPTETWQGLSGRITEYFNNFTNPNEFDHYLCGVKPMVDEVLARLKELGVPDEQIHFEKY